MYTVVNFVDMTDFIPPDDEENGSGNSSAITANASLSDPNSTWDFVIDDPTQQFNLQNFMPVVVFDENAPSLNNFFGIPIPTVPSMNFGQNVLLETSGLWTISGTLSGLVTFYPSGPNVTMTFANNAVGSGIASQQTLLGYVQPGVKYMLSMYLLGSGTINNIQGLLKITFQDAFGNTLGSTTTGTFTPTLSQQQVNITAIAPANTAYAYFSFGGQTTNSTNSGEITWGSPQFEPMWFTNKGVSYPTPDCNFSQVSCVLMPDGTTSRACRRFAGYIEDRVNSYAGKQRHTVVQCASSSKLLETIGLVSASYTSTQDTTILSNAISNLPTNNSIIGQIATGQQQTFGPSSTLIPGVVIDSISWNNATFRQVLNDLGAQSGSLYYVDAYYYLWYVPPSFAGTIIMLSDTPDNITSFPYSNFSIEYDSTNPLNTVLVQGSKQKAAVFTETFSGNGSTTVFNLSYPPENVHGISISAVTVRTGVDGIDNSKFGASLTYKALINKQAQTIKFATAPASGTNNISISYTYEDQVISQVIAADAVAQQKNQFWGLVNDSAITSTPAAKNRGLAELQAYAFERVIITFDLLGIYVPPGGMALFTNQSESLAGAPFVIQTVQSDFQGGGIDNWQYTAGVYNPTIIDHLRNTTKAIQKSPTTANVVVIASIDVALFDVLHMNDSVVANVSRYASAVGVDSPSDYLRMGETKGTVAHDISGNGYNGTLNGGIVLGGGSALAGDSNKSMIFNGSSGYISLVSGANPSGSACTIECWFNLANTTFANYPRIYSYGDPAAHNTGVEINLNAGGAGGSFIVGNGTTFAQATTTTSFAANTWYHIVGVFNGSTVQLYVNSVAQTSASLSGSIGNPSTTALIGRYSLSALDYFPGNLQESAIYPTALSATRVLAHWSAAH